MDWFIQLFTSTESVAHIAILYAIVIALGVYLGKIKIGGISLGVTFVSGCDVCSVHGHRCRSFRLHGSERHSHLHTRFRAYPVCIHDRSAGGSRLFREFPRGRHEAQFAGHGHDSAQRGGDVCMLLHLLRHQ